MLCVTFIMVLISACMALGVRVSRETLSRTVEYSEAQTLASSAVNVITDELRHAQNIIKTESGSGESIIEYTSITMGDNTRIITDSEQYPDRLCLVNGSSVYNCLPEAAYGAISPNDDGKANNSNQKLFFRNFSIQYEAEDSPITVSFEIVSEKDVVFNESVFQVKPLNP